jgi:hypothetical protein
MRKIKQYLENSIATHLTENIMIVNDKIQTTNNVSTNTDLNEDRVTANNTDASTNTGSTEDQVNVLKIEAYYYQTLYLNDATKRSRSFATAMNNMVKRKDVEVDIDYEIIESLNNQFKSLSSEHLLCHYRAAFATGDGNCLYRTFSFLESKDVRNFSQVKSQLLFILTDEVKLKKFIEFFLTETGETFRSLVFPDICTNDQNITSLPNQIKSAVDNLLITDGFADNIALLVLVESFRTQTRIVVWTHNNNIEVYVDPLMNNNKFSMKYIYFNGGFYHSQTGHFMPLYSMTQEQEEKASL